jgi:hypothetical protein
MSDIYNTIKSDFKLLEEVIDTDFVEPYTIVEQCMSESLRNILGDTIYAYYANQAAKIDELERSL